MRQYNKSCIFILLCIRSSVIPSVLASFVVPQFQSKERLLSSPAHFMSSSAKDGTGTNSNLSFRSPKIADVDPIADLLVDCFETELKWFDWPERDKRRKLYRNMLQQPFLQRIKATKTVAANIIPKHEDEQLWFLLMVETAETVAKKKKIIGFIQVGLLPPPVGFEMEYPDEPQTGEEEPTKVWNGIEVTVKKEKNPVDVPYIANLCVIPDCRKLGIGKKMVDICLKWLEKERSKDVRTDRSFQNVFIAVDTDNKNARDFYQRVGFLPVSNEEKEEAILRQPRIYMYRPIP